MQKFVKRAPPIKPCILLGVTLFLVYDGVGFINVTPQVFGFHICTAFHEHEHHASLCELIAHET